ncbi:response regulator [Natronorubrum texcoconense]|uniref:Response regulator receiver domain-containing protein n=1 Tax=Natronorubrum texcoconense TaxID=1095776 RepID=A0A1G9ET24_9EURY|nr:response regulator [Natronorubrum texcoconense]SDK79290.1 Response regulator receiver domain-containing protein [Natronorubrum texcoconense]
MDSQPSAPGQEVEILLVEDNPGDARLVTELFSDAHIVNTLHVATDHREALDFVNQRGEFTDVPRPDIVLLDWHLPRATGDEVLRAMKEDSALSQIPVIVLTGSDVGEELIQTSEFEANAYLTKPVDPDDFISLVRSFEFFWLSVIRSPPPEL